MRTLALLLALGLAACAPRTPAPAAQPQGVDRVVGKVRVVGSAPVNVRVVVHDTAAGTVTVEGPLAPEIRALSGAVVEVWGTPAPRSALEAAGYRIVSVDGAPVVVGVVERAPGGGLLLRKERGEVVHLTGGMSQLRPGQKVWVQGPETVRVQTYGVITP